MTNLWDDPYESTQREWKHGPWQGMPPRQVWNSSPNHRHDRPCIECGYRWGHTDFTYRSHPDNPKATHSICWNCWMIDNNPEQVRKYWNKIDGTEPKGKEPARLERL